MVRLPQLKEVTEVLKKPDIGIIVPRYISKETQNSVEITPLEVIAKVYETLMQAELIQKLDTSS